MKEEINTLLLTGQLEGDRIHIVYDEHQYELKFEDNKPVFIKKEYHYPNNFDDCCKILGTDIVYYNNEIDILHKLIICRNAFWKLANNWEPNWNDNSYKYIIECENDIIETDAITTSYQKIFAFPTSEMRNVFYEIYKDDIIKCKKFL